MFRFIHAADPHLDSPLRGLEAREGAPAELLRGATRRAFENLVALAIAEKVAFLLIAGDLYDGDWRDYSTGLFFRGQMSRLRDAGIPVHLISGNHDAASVITSRLTLPENTRVHPTDRVASEGVGDLPVVIHGRGFANRAVPENLARDYPQAVPGKFNIGLLHTSLNGRPGHDTYAPCAEADLRGKGYDYWALGHIHQPEVVSRDPWIVFAGNCQGRHARETGPRGCRLVTVDDSLRVVDAEWRDLDVVRWAEVPVDLDGVGEEAEAWSLAGDAMARAIRDAGGRLVAARVTLSGETPLHGALHRERERCEAELLARARDLGDSAIWVERVQVATRPVYDVERLAERDELTRIVVEQLGREGEDSWELPEEVGQVLELLPEEARRELDQETGAEGRGALLGEVRSILLDALGARGGETP